MCVVKAGGPVYRIGVGGGAASSVHVQVCVIFLYFVVHRIPLIHPSIHPIINLSTYLLLYM